ncbi:MAG TPA: hypothetical protein VFP61_02500, partial [Acidimicrobiales bacterium]|nr:hypothetical protein [Acidimicrobiales bacterium]
MIRGLHRRLQAAGAVATASAVAAGACLWAAPVASADQLSTLRAQAQAVASQIDDLGRQEAALSEQYDGAVLGAQAAGAKVASATAELAAARAAAGRARSALASEVLDEYTGAANVPAEGGPRALDDASARLLGAAYVDDVASGQQDALDAYHLATVQATTAEAQLRAAQAAAVDQVHRVAGAKAAVEATQ